MKNIQPVPKQWTDIEIKSDADKAKLAFQQRRTNQINFELGKLTKERFPLNTSAADKAVECLVSCFKNDFDPEVCRIALTALLEKDVDGVNGEALRYLAYPPISADDLEAIAEIPSLTKKTAEGKKVTKNGDEIGDDEAAKRVVTVIAEALDEVRFNWLLHSEYHEISEAMIKEHKSFAVRSTALMMASQQTQTGRRSEEKAELEESVRDLLLKQGYKELPKKSMADSSALHLGIEKGHFMKECTVAGDNGDFVICLCDGRFMFIECKASNSGINSRKRLNKEAVKNIVDLHPNLTRDLH